MNSPSAFKWENVKDKITFTLDQYHYFNKESRLDEAMTGVFVDKFAKLFGLNLFGIDIIITSEGKHLVIDCNYFSSYDNLPEAELAAQFDKLYLTLTKH
jgi:hypothetical protein